MVLRICESDCAAVFLQVSVRDLHHQKCRLRSPLSEVSVAISIIRSVGCDRHHQKCRLRSPSSEVPVAIAIITSVNCDRHHQKCQWRHFMEVQIVNTHFLILMRIRLVKMLISLKEITYIKTCEKIVAN